MSMKRIIKLILIFFLFVYVSRINAENQRLTKETAIDSSTGYNRAEALLYQIELMNFETALARLRQNPANNSLLTEIMQLKAEANQYAAEQAFEFANLIFEEINYLLRAHIPPVKEPVRPIPLSANPVFQEKNSRQTNWNREIIGGIDYWDQKLEMSYSDYDSVMLEGATNPFLGARFGFEHGNPKIQLLRSELLIKNSRDYFTTNGEFRFLKSTVRNTSLEIKNFVDWTYYKVDTELSYLQNNLTAVFHFRPYDGFRVQLSEEFRLRDYSHEAEFYSSYFQNKIQLAVNYMTPAFNRWGAAARIYHRIHPHYTYKNYKKIYFDFSGEYAFNSRFKFRFDNEIIFKDFTAAGIDTLYQSDYFENYSIINVKYNLFQALFLELENISSFKKYKQKMSYLRDNFESEFESTLSYYFKTSNSFKIGYLYAFNVHQGEQGKNDLPINIEDYYSHGFTFSFDCFLGETILFNITDNFSSRRYPNSTDLSTLNLYSDRNVNSLFLLFSWNISAKYELSVIANYDDDRNRKNEHSDSKNTMFSLEFIRKF